MTTPSYPSHGTEILLYGSEIAACIGDHKYRKRWEAFLDVFKRVNRGQDYARAIDRLENMGCECLDVEQKVVQIVESIGINAKVDDFLNHPVKCSEELNQAITLFEVQLTDHEDKIKKEKQHFKEEAAQKTETLDALTKSLKEIESKQHLLSEELMIAENGPQTDERFAKLIEQKTTVDDLVNQKRSMIDDTQIALQTAIGSLNRIEQTWSDFKTVKKQIITKKQTSFGKEKETDIVASKRLGIILDNNNKFYKKMFGDGWGIGGRIDGIRDGELIEIKNRKSQLYDPLPNYDVLQLQCYMQLLDVQRATMIQCLSQSDGQVHTKETVVQRDDATWKNTVLPELQVFVDTLRKFMKDTLLQDRFLQTPDNQKSRLMLKMIKESKESKPESPSTKKKKKTKSDETSVAPTKKRKVKVANKASEQPKSCPSVEKLSVDCSTCSSQPFTPPPVPPPPPTAQKPNQIISFFDDPSIPACEPVNTDTPLWNYLPKDWSDLLDDQRSMSYWDPLMKFVDSEYNSVSVFPPRDKVFNAFRHCGVKDVRVVILGQDPYINHGEAMGLSFSVPAGVAIPRSLDNIYKEIKAEGLDPPKSGDLTCWAAQGVLLLNSVLTVRRGKSDSHAGKGWEQFTDCVIQRLSEKNPHIVFMLWGRPAQTKGRLIAPGHTILETSHPSPLSVHRGFNTCGHFSKCNEALKEHGLIPINWAGL